MTELEAIDWCEQFRDNIIATGVEKEKYTLALKAIRTAITALKNQVANGKWIPVTERLPESLVPVLCWYEYFRYGNYNCMYQTYGLGYYFRDDMWGGEVSNGHNTRVLAWMPLPDPPKEVQP